MRRFFPVLLPVLLLLLFLFPPALPPPAAAGIIAAGPTAENSIPFTGDFDVTISPAAPPLLLSVGPPAFGRLDVTVALAGATAAVTNAGPGPVSGSTDALGLSIAGPPRGAGPGNPFPDAALLGEEPVFLPASLTLPPGESTLAAVAPPVGFGWSLTLAWPLGLAAGPVHFAGGYRLLDPSGQLSAAITGGDLVVAARVSLEFDPPPPPPPPLAGVPEPQTWGPAALAALGALAWRLLVRRPA